jgi:L-arabinonolactonase
MKGRRLARAREPETRSGRPFGLVSHYTLERNDGHRGKASSIVDGGMPDLSGLAPVGDFTMLWGESLRWDDRRSRLYFVDCAAQTLHWLEGGKPPLNTAALPALGTGIALTEGDELVICLEDGLYVVDPDTGRTTLLAPYPDELHGRANDMTADASGNIVTGTLNLAPGTGGFWWFSARHGWKCLDDGIGNANGPGVIVHDGEETLVFADTIAGVVYAYGYDSTKGEVSARRVYADYGTIGGAPDGATIDTDGRVWSCVLRTGKLAVISQNGIDDLIDLPVRNPSDVAFGGPSRDTLFLTAIAVDLGDGPPSDESKHLLSAELTGAAGRPEFRARL